MLPAVPDGDHLVRLKSKIYKQCTQNADNSGKICSIPQADENRQEPASHTHAHGGNKAITPSLRPDDTCVANNLDALLARAKSIRQDILRMTTEAGSGHPSSSLSATEVVTALYFGGFLRHDPKNPHWPDRDRFILSKGHAAPVLYAALAQAGYFPHDKIMTLRKLGSPLEGHPNMKRLAGVEASTGSLGQGLSLGIGHALAARTDKKGYHTYVLTGDGELDGPELGGCTGRRQVSAR